MKKAALLKKLRQIAKNKNATLDLVRQGGSHEVYRIGDYQFVVPRHREINERTADDILKEARK